MTDRGNIPSSVEAQAVVIGASITGLLTAQILSRIFRQVIILDRDHLPTGPVPRKTVPQEHHVHLLLQRGKQIMENLLPGLMAELEAEGALSVDLCSDVKCYQAGLWKRRWPSEISAHYCTRTLLEYVLRRRVLALPNVELRDRVAATGLIFDECARSVVGVRSDPRNGSASDIPATLTVDASGRGSQVVRWLTDAGLPDPEREEIVTHLGYVSGLFQPPADKARDWKVLLYLPKIPEQKRMAVISPVEDGLWMITAGAWFDGQPEPDHHALLDYLRHLSVPDLYEAAKNATPTGKLKRFRMPGGLRRRFDLMQRWPEGFLVLGDAVCSINPIYSQGMSASALQVEALSPELRKLADGDAATHEAQRAICEAADRPWQQAAAIETRFKTGVTRPSLRSRIRTAYFDRLVTASAVDRHVAMALLEVNNLVADPAILTKPGLALRTLLAGRRGTVEQRI